MISLARLARLTCPPLRWRISVPRRWLRLTVSSVSSMHWRTSARLRSGGSRSRAVYQRASPTLSESCRMSFCGTTAMSCLRASKLACRSCAVDLRPGRRRAAVRPLRADSSVDLPEPDGPSRQTNSRGRITSVMSSSSVKRLAGLAVGDDAPDLAGHQLDVVGARSAAAALCRRTPGRRGRCRAGRRAAGRPADGCAAPLTKVPLALPRSTRTAWPFCRVISAWTREICGCGR